MQAPKEYNEDGTLRPVEERMAARMRAMANDFIVGELLIGGGVDVIGKVKEPVGRFVKETIKTSGLDKKTEEIGKVILVLQTIQKKA